VSEPDDESVRRRTELVEVYRHYATDGGVQTKWSLANPGNRAIVRELEAVRDRMLTAHLAGRGAGVVLDLGCGSASLVPQALADRQLLVGAELLIERIAPARERGLHDGYVGADGTALPFRDKSIGVVILSTVLTSIVDDDARLRVGREIERALRPDGFVIVYDARVPNPRNRYTKAITRRELRRIFPAYAFQGRSVTLLPQLARRLGGRTDALYPILAAIPVLRTHNVGLLVRRFAAAEA
jgi:SAM-dependent methyltransferase